MSFVFVAAGLIELVASPGRVARACDDFVRSRLSSPGWRRFVAPNRDQQLSPEGDGG
jgi:hypothetical protein